jgi:hypothetical protein
VASDRSYDPTMNMIKKLGQSTIESSGRWWLIATVISLLLGPIFITDNFAFLHADIMATYLLIVLVCLGTLIWYENYRCERHEGNEGTPGRCVWTIIFLAVMLSIFLGSSGMCKFDSYCDSIRLLYVAIGIILSVYLLGHLTTGRFAERMDRVFYYLFWPILLFSFISFGLMASGQVPFSISNLSDQDMNVSTILFLILGYCFPIGVLFALYGFGYHSGKESGRLDS